MSLKNRRGRSSYTNTGGPYGGYPGGPGGTSGTRKNTRRRRRGFAGPVLIICAIVAVLVAADHWVNSGKVYGGVGVGDVALGGKTPDEARVAVKERAMGSLEEIRLSGPQDFTRTAGEMGVRFNVDDTVERAYAVGREGSVLDRLQQRLRALTVGVRIEPDVDYRPEKARAEVEEIAARVNHEPKEASVRVVGSQVEVAQSRTGFELDPAATMASVGDAINDVTGEAKIEGTVLRPEVNTGEAEAAAKTAREAVSEQLVFTAEGKDWTLSPADVGYALDINKKDGELDVAVDRARLDERLATVYDDLAVKPKEAFYDFDDNGAVIVSPGREGRAVEGDKLLGAVEDGLFEDKREYKVPLAVDKPQYTTTELESQKPTELLGSYRTNYRATTDQGKERVENLKIASNAVNGEFVAPGEVFSMVEHVQDLDYNDAHVIVKSKETTAEGGGLCQVTSTLYNAVLYAGLPVIERQPHDSQLPYIRPGMDATVWYGDKTTTVDDTDMKFRNTTDGYVLLQEYVADDGYIYANVYGVPDNVEVEMSSEKVWMTEDASQWITHYTRTKNGKVVYEDSWKSDYSALYDDKGKKIPTPKVPIAEVDGTYLGPEF